MRGSHMLLAMENQKHLNHPDENGRLMSLQIKKFLESNRITQQAFINAYPSAFKQTFAEALGTGFTEHSPRVIKEAQAQHITRSTTKHKLNTTTPEYEKVWFKHYEKPAIIRAIKLIAPNVEVFAGDIDLFQCDPTGTGYGSTVVHTESITQAITILKVLLDEANEYEGDLDAIATGTDPGNHQDIYNVFENLGKMSREVARRFALEPYSVITRGLARDHFKSICEVE